MKNTKVLPYAVTQPRFVDVVSNPRRPPARQRSLDSLQCPSRWTEDGQKFRMGNAPPATSLKTLSRQHRFGSPAGDVVGFERIITPHHTHHESSSIL
eukprot:scaffold27108_cov62-Cyclotella_meneghiniana.AAC.3